MMISRQVRVQTWPPYRSLFGWQVLVYRGFLEDEER